MDLKIGALANGTALFPTFRIGGELDVNGLGFGAMQLVGRYGYGLPADGVDRAAMLRHTVALGINFIDTANLYGPRINEHQIAAALHPYPADRVMAPKAGSRAWEGRRICAGRSRAACAD